MLAVVKFTSRMALFAIVGQRNNTQKHEFAVFLGRVISTTCVHPFSKISCIDVWKFDGKGPVEGDMRPFRATACLRDRKAQSLIAILTVVSVHRNLIGWCSPC